MTHHAKTRSNQPRNRKAGRLKKLMRLVCTFAPTPPAPNNYENFRVPAPPLALSCARKIHAKQELTPLSQDANVSDVKRAAQQRIISNIDMLLVGLLRSGRCFIDITSVVLFLVLL